LHYFLGRDENPGRVRTFLLSGFVLRLCERKIPPAPLDDQKPGRKLSEIKKPDPEGLVFLCSEECLSVARLTFDSLHGLGDDQR
jgi:hypothetical protein